MKIVIRGAKMLQQMRNGQLNWRIEDLQRVAAANGVQWRSPGGGGSHVIFSAPGVRDIVSVPAHRPIKPIYVTRFIVLVDLAGEVAKE